MCSMRIPRDLTSERHSLMQVSIWLVVASGLRTPSFLVEAIISGSMSRFYMVSFRTESIRGIRIDPRQRSGTSISLSAIRTTRHQSPWIFSVILSGTPAKKTVSLLIRSVAPVRRLWPANRQTASASRWSSMRSTLP